MAAWKVHGLAKAVHIAIQKRLCMRVVKLLLDCLAFYFILVISSCGPVMTDQAMQSSASDPVQATTPITPHPVVATSTKSVVAKPERLIIPSIGVNTAIELVGILDNGELGTPMRDPWDDVGWYAIGPHPGQKGSAVIDGHLDRPGGFPAIFWNLRYVHVGDNIMIIDTAGKTVHFRVTRIALYTPKEAPIQEIFGDESGSYLNLITCAGDWIPSQHQTTLRLVVFTTLAQ